MRLSDFALRILLAATLTTPQVIWGGGVQQASSGPKPEAAVPQEALALVSISGRTMTIFPASAPPQSTKLDFEYLSASATSDGRALVGWGFPDEVATPSSRVSSVVVLTSEFGRHPLIVRGFVNVGVVSASPDKRRLAVVATNPATHFRGLQIVNLQTGLTADSSIPIERDSPGLDHYVGWSPDSRSVRFALGGEIIEVDIESGRRRVLGVGKSPSWSADGRFMAYFTAPFRLVVADTESGGASVSVTHGVEGRARWAPDSRRFLVAEDWGSLERNAQCANNSRLVEYRLPALRSSPLLNPCDIKPELFSWVSDWRRWLSN